MHNPRALIRALAALRPQRVPLVDLLFRSIHLCHFANFATADPILASGGGPTGSRYVPPNGPAALYAAFDVDTAHREGNQVFYQAVSAPAGPALMQAGGLRPDPVVVVGFHVRTSHLLNLTDPGIHHQLGIQSLAELLGPWRFVRNPPTQVLGKAVFADRHFEGVVFPSAQSPGRRCVVLFPSRLQPGSQVDFLDRTTGIAAHIP